MADIVAVEQDGVDAARMELGSTRLAMVDLPAPDRPVNHSTAGLLCFSRARSARADGEVLAMDVGRAAQAEVDHAGGRPSRWNSGRSG